MSEASQDNEVAENGADPLDQKFYDEVMVPVLRAEKKSEEEIGEKYPRVPTNEFWKNYPKSLIEGFKGYWRSEAVKHGLIQPEKEKTHP